MKLSHTVLPKLALGASFVAAAALHAHAVYCVAMLAVSTLARRRRDAAAFDPPTIAIIIAAHEEEAVIARCVKSLVEQAYPRDRFRVFVVADRCTDSTAIRARDAGAQVIERSHGPQGKSAAVRYAFESASANEQFDAFAVFDADNVADAGFLEAVARRLREGERVVQGFVDCANPDATWVAASSALGFYAIATVAQAPREALGLSVPLMGTAWAAKTELFHRFLPQLRSLADDLELLSLFAEAGIRVAYEPAARVLDEKPAMLRAAVQQRHRWMQGRWAVASRHFIPLMAVAFGARRHGKRPTFIERFRAFDVALQLVGPSLLFSAVVLAVVGALALCVQKWGHVRFLPHFPLRTLYLAAIYYFAPALAIGRVSPPKKVWAFYLIQPIYILLSIPLAVSGFLTRSATVWRRTAHTGS